MSKITVFAIAAGVCALASTGCSTTPPVPLELADVPSAEELYSDGVAKLEDGGRFLWFDTRDHEGAVEVFQDIIDNYPYSDYAILAELKIADSYYEREKYEEALSYYRDFTELHPKHAQVPYALLRAARCHVARVRPANRDQTATEESLEFLEQLLARFPHSSEAREAETLWVDMRTRLGEHVMQIGDFYLDRSEFASASERYRSVLNQFPGLGLDAEALYKLGVCYTAMNRADEAGQIFQVILDNYEGSEVAQAAEDLIPAAN